MRFKALLTVLVTLLALGSGISAQARKPPKPPPGPRFDRAQFMLMNLNRGPKSTGGYVDQSRRTAAQMTEDLDKALRQLEQVERTYAKSRGRPDDRPLQGPAERIKQAQQTAAQLLTQLKEAEQDLKTSIQHTLILEQ